MHQWVRAAAETWQALTQAHEEHSSVSRQAHMFLPRDRKATLQALGVCIRGAGERTPGLWHTLFWLRDADLWFPTCPA